MSEPRSRSKVIALGLAIVAVAVAAVAVVVAARRGGSAGPAAGGAGGSGVATEDRRVQAADVVKLDRDAVEAVVEGGEPRGVRVSDGALAHALGLEPDDLITMLMGDTVRDGGDVRHAIFQASLSSATTLYVELVRRGTPRLLRWRLDGDLRTARHASSTSTRPTSTFSPSVSPDPLASQVVRVDDTHARIPRALVDQLLANPTDLARRARIVPAIKNGKPNGFKVYAIRPSSVLAQLGFRNGDTLRAINGYEMTRPDQALEVYTKLRGASSITVDIDRYGQPLILTITIQ